ncbi:hypothetical protein DBADOPDK_02788 [Pseudomonas sp. MM223]|nr:hypothetical protein DBADOPDK_02788 [Pseudomonas sp. MM223]
MPLRQLSIQWKITLLAGLCLAGIVTLLVGLSLYRMDHELGPGQGQQHADADRGGAIAHRIAG